MLSIMKFQSMFEYEYYNEAMSLQFTLKFNQNYYIHHVEKTCFLFCNKIMNVLKINLIKQ